MNISSAGSHRLAKSVLLTSLLLFIGISNAKVTDADILNDQKTVDDIVHNGLGLKGQRFSPLDKINLDTAKDMHPVWAYSLGGEKQRGQESQPLVKDGVMFVTGSYSRIYAVDTRTGEDDDLVIFGTLDAKLVALNQKTGKVVWKKTIGDYKAGYSYTAAPLIVKGMVITGNSGGEFGVIGKVDARDALTGELIWERPTVGKPISLEFAHASW